MYKRQFNDLIPDNCDETIGLEQKQTNDGQNISADLEYNIPAISIITLVIIVLFARKKYSG